jgi:signal transduction histidine kinase
MLCVVSEDTDRVISERRMATLRDLGSDPRVLRTEQETLEFAGRQLDRNRRDLPFTLTYLLGDDGASVRLAASSGVIAGHPAVQAADPGLMWPVTALLRGEPALVDLRGSPLSDLPAGEWSEPPVQALTAPLAQQGGAPYGFLVAGLNRYRPLDEGYRGFVDLVAGYLAAGIASARSYHDQQRRAEELAELDRAKTAFFSNISHEFRTPLTLIMGPVQELQRQLADADPQVRDELEVIRRNGLRLGRLVNSLLDFSRIEAGRMQASYEPADIARVTAELASVFRSAVDRAGLAFEVDCPPLPKLVYLDRGMWEKVMLNLLSNALKFTFDGSIRVAVRAENDQAVVEVADTGIGIPEQEMPRLFERFHRIENARPARTRAAASAWPWSRNLSSCMAAPSPRPAPRARAPRSLWACPSGPATCLPMRSYPRGTRPRCRLPLIPLSRKPCAGCPGPGRPMTTGPCTSRSRPAVTPTLRPRRAPPCPRVCWSPTTTPTCASTWGGCCAPLTTRSPQSPTGRPPWKRFALELLTW